MIGLVSVWSDLKQWPEVLRPLGREAPSWFLTFTCLAAIVAAFMLARHSRRADQAEREVTRLKQQLEDERDQHERQKASEQEAREQQAAETKVNVERTQEELEQAREAVGDWAQQVRDRDGASQRRREFVAQLFDAVFWLQTDFPRVYDSEPLAVSVNALKEYMQRIRTMASTDTRFEGIEISARRAIQRLELGSAESKDDLVKEAGRFATELQNFAHRAGRMEGS